VNLRQQLIIAWGDGELPEEAVHIPTHKHASSILLSDHGAHVSGSKSSARIYANIGIINMHIVTIAQRWSGFPDPILPVFATEQTRS
jgi:hypothetical protein